MSIAYPPDEQQSGTPIDNVQSTQEIRINSQRAITRLKQILDGSTTLAPLIQTVLDYIEYLELPNSQQSTLLASNQEELARRLDLIQTSYKEEQEARSRAEQDSQQVREENGELLEELAGKDTYIAELEEKLTTTTVAAIGMVHELAQPKTCTHCQELEQELKQERQTLDMERRRYEDLDSRHTALYIKWEGRQKWREQLLANETIPNANCKLVGAYLWENGLEYTDSERKFVKEQIATDLGCSPDTVASALNRLNDYNVINVRSEDLTLPDGTIHKNALTYVSRNTLVDPTTIRMEKKQGSAKPKVCFRDSTTPMNAYTIRHCPTHGEIGLYGQPGLPKEADEMLMIDDFIRKYQNRVPRALSDYRDPVTSLLVDTTSTNDGTRTSEEKKPSSTAIAPTTNDNWPAAYQIFADLDAYGLTLEYRDDGRYLKHTAPASIIPTTAQKQNLRERIKRYDTEVREYLSMQAGYDPQLATQLLNSTLPEEKQVSAQHYISSPSTASCSKGDNHEGGSHERG